MSPPRDGSVQGVLSRIRGELERRTLAAAMAWAGAIVSTVLVVAWVIAGPDGWKAGTAMPLLLDLGAGAAVALVVAAFLARRLLSGERRIVRAMEEAAGVTPGGVLGALELSRGLPEGVSESLAFHGERGVLQRLSTSGTDLSGTPGRTAAAWKRRGLRALAVTVPLVGVLGAVSPQRALESWRGLVTPLELLAQPALPPLEIEPGTTELLRGSPLEIRIRAPGRSRVVLHWQAVGEVSQERELEPLPGDSSAFAHELPSVSAPLEYRVSAPDGARSPLFRVTPVDPLFVGQLRLEVTFPAHTGRAVEEYGPDAPPLDLPVGSRLRITGEASRDLAIAALTPAEARPGSEGEAVDLDVEGRRFSGSWVPTRSGTWLWHFRDVSGGEPVRSPPPLELGLVRDSVPQVVLVEPGRDTVLALTQRQPLVVEARDDYGLREMTLLAYRVTTLGERGEPVIHGTPLQGTRSALARPVLDVSGWGLLPGDAVRYRVRVRDNSPAGQVAETPEYVLRVPDVTELRRDAQDRLEEATRRLEAAAERAAETEEEMRELERAGQVRQGERAAPQSPGESGALGFEDREELARVAERQEEMLDELEGLGRELEEMEESLRESGAADPELGRDLAELQELLREVASPELRERLAELRESLEARDARQARRQVGEMAREQEELRRRLEESLERFRRAAAEQDFRATAEEARELAREERALADALREGDRPERRAEQQEELRERSRGMEERMEELEERLQRLGESEAQEGVQSAARESTRARQAMQRASESARQGRSGEAGEAADEAAEDLEEAAERLQDARDEMARRLEEEVRRALERTASDALALARRQEEIRQEMEGAGRQGIADLRGEEAAVAQGVRSLAEHLPAASQGAGANTRNVEGGVGRALEAVERTLEAMEGTGATPSPRASAERTVDALNEVALQALAAAGQAGQSGGAQGAQELTEQLQALAQQQAGVNNQAGQLMPMELGQEALANQLGELSRSQGDVADQLGELSRDPASSEGALGDLEALGREAEELARRLERGRLDPGTRERQERLFHRLLDAGRSLEKDEPSRERESRAAGAFERPDVTPLTSETLQMLRFALPGALRLRSLPPAQRQMVVEYFERLNRQGGTEAETPPSDGRDSAPGGRR